MRPRLISTLALLLCLAASAAAVGLFGSRKPTQQERQPIAPPVGPPAPPRVKAPAPGEPINLDRADVMRTIDLGGRPVRELEGNARVLHHGRVFTFGLGRYDQEAGILTCTGAVRVVEGERVLTADEVTYDERRETVSARGHVHGWGDSLESWAEKGAWYNGLKQGELQVQARILDRRRRVELRAGQVDADHEKGVYTATRQPVLTLQEDPPTVLNARLIVWRRADSLAVARGEVRMNREDFQATCDSLVWHERDERMDFLLKPLLTKGERRIQGDRVTALIRGRKSLDSLWVQGGARMDSPADSVSTRLRDVLQGRRMELDFDEGRLESVYVDGQARSVIFLKDEEGQPGMNVADAKRMWFTLKDQKLETVHMAGGMEARWVPLREPPGAAAPGAAPAVVPPSKEEQPEGQR